MFVPTEIVIVYLVCFVSSRKHVMHPLLNRLILKIALIWALSHVEDRNYWPVAQRHNTIHCFEVSEELN